MWNDSDRKGWLDFLGHKVKNNLFYFPGYNQRTSIWYEKTEMEEIENIVLNKIQDKESGVVSIVIKRLDSFWLKLSSYLKDEKKIENLDEFLQYYDYLVTWWSGMVVGYIVPNLEQIDVKIRNKFLEYRTQSEKATEKMSKLMTEFWIEKYPQYKDLTTVLLPKEADNIARKRITESQRKEFLERIHGYIMFNGKIYLKSKMNKILSENKIVMNEEEGSMEIKGRTAFGGKAKGIVKVIKVHKDLKDFNAGQILVTEMTNPDYVPYMKKAAAIITDEGGLTCHAAIVSREFNIPCIVGTRNATKVLKTGDFVEVDADKGVVKIIKRGK